MKRTQLLWMIPFFSIHFLVAQEESSSDTQQTYRDFVVFSQADQLRQYTNSQQTNAVFIQQIGDKNTILSNIQSNSSLISIVQKGNENDISIREQADRTEKELTQLGNRNSIEEIGFNAGLVTKSEVLQQGSELKFRRYGSNSLSKDMKVKMTGTDKTIIIRNF
ncbi:hypothetical protein ACFSTE_14765 [Aquimarina hainanensis]|uniref:Curlin associated repeat-containing protein n=1 Tax=Aquimarina hainanensis TaxID=1578017 RepID=A0ABW5NBX4_9FLAO|nr:hypothetical protein [Aquimarina sp. TRL1]QKX03564.1 hypothetical protein HN014_01085 [Aquimarina sp. TRL1]